MLILSFSKNNLLKSSLYTKYLIKMLVTYQTIVPNNFLSVELNYYSLKNISIYEKHWLKRDIVNSFMTEAVII